MKLDDDPNPLERRPTRRGAATSPEASGLAPAHWTADERGALERAVNLQAALSHPEGGAALERLSGFQSRAGERFRCLPARPGARGRDLELLVGGVRVLLRGIQIGAQRVVRDAPLLLLGEAPGTGEANIVIYINAIQRVERGEARQMNQRENPNTAELSAMEPQLKALCEREAWGEAMALIGQVHGPTVRGLMIKKLRDESEAHEVWLQWYENVRRALKKFRWESRFSTWSYRIALNAFFAHKRKQGRAGLHTVPLNPEVDAAPEVRYATARGLVGRSHDTTYDWVKTTNIQHFRSICEAHLKDEEQKLLQWRLHENRPWAEIARELSDEGASDAELKKAVQRLHVRFHRMVKRLHKLAVREGLVTPEPDEP